MTGSPDAAALAWAAERLGIDFADPALLRMALTHRSLEGEPSYERLEFLGDRILGAVVAVDLYKAHPDEPEGKLHRRLQTMVNRGACAAVARTLGVGAHVRLDAQARADGGADSENVLGDVMEALIGAVFVDQGETAAADAIRRWWAGQAASDEGPPKHPKSRLQEWAAARGLRMPAYELLGRFGPHHAPRFAVRVTVAGLPPVEAEGPSKQEAETRAADAFLETQGG